jgi:hypothetical protein
MINLSKFWGIPASKEVAIKQFWEIVQDSIKKPYLYLDYLVLRKIEEGQYKGYWGVYTQDKKPKHYETGKDKFKFIWRTNDKTRR